LRTVAFAQRLAAIDGLAGDAFILVEWTAEVGAHWIAPLHVHHGDDEGWYVLEGELGFRLGDEEVVATEALPSSPVVAHPTRTGMQARPRPATS
jgi:mannose-6-phosphate isomerase-like protein (cupin superfamily)